MGGGINLSLKDTSAKMPSVNFWLHLKKLIVMKDSFNKDIQYFTLSIKHMCVFRLLKIIAVHHFPLPFAYLGRNLPF